MNVENNTSSQVSVATELDLLKARADQMGITYKGNIGVDALKAKIENRLNGENTVNDEANEGGASEKSPPKSKAEQMQEIRESLIKDQMALVRVRVANLNPSKNDLHGEIITVANRFIGTVSKFIPFGEQTQNGYHIPKCIYEDLKARKFQQIRTKRVKGQLIPDNRILPEYSVEVLPPLTPEELKELGDRQSAATRLAGSDD
jgi:hypothetical protein